MFFTPFDGFSHKGTLFVYYFFTATIPVTIFFHFFFRIQFWSLLFLHVFTN